MKNRSILQLVIFCFTLFFLSTQNLSAQHNLTLSGHLSYSPIYLSNLWGYVDTVQNEYALVGTTQGLSVVDVTDPSAPTEKYAVNGAVNPWREVKTFAHRAYVTTEGGGGLMIVNMSHLPDTNHTYHFFTDSGKIQRAHTLWIDENGYLYLFGTNIGNGGVQIYNLNPNPDTPVYVGQYDDSYIHDGFVRGDTLWAAHIYNGTLEIVNVTDKAAPFGMAVFSTTSHFTHSSWPTSDDHYLFTTDEVANSYLGSYNVQNLNSIIPLDVIQADPGSDATVHNVFLYNNDFATTSYYCQGVVLFDVTYPDNMIEVGNYNTAESSCNGFNGCWGEYPYLPSGNIIASDIQNGLYILKPTYIHACWLKGIVQDSITLSPIINVTVTVTGTQNTANSKVDGTYETGATDSGLYNISYSAAGYYTKTINNVHLVNGVIDTLNVLLDRLPYFTITGLVYDSQDKFIDNAQVLFTNNNNTYLDSTDINGSFSIPDFFSGKYKVFIAKWGYKLYYIAMDSITNNGLNFDVRLDTGYYDDFSLNLGWKSNSNATSGQWIRGVPIGTVIDSEYVNPDSAVNTTHNNECFMTGNSPGYYRNSCLYGGYTQLISPVINLLGYNDPYISYYTWFFNLRNELPTNDSLVVEVNSKGFTTDIQSIKLTNTDSCQWVFQKFRIKNFVPLSDSMVVSFFAQNTDSSANIYKAAVDIFQITDSIGAGINTLQPNSIIFSIYPNPFEDNTTISYDLNGPGNYSICLIDVTGRVVYEQKLNDNKGVLNISLKNYSAGFYIVQLKDKTTVLRSVKTAKTD